MPQLIDGRVCRNDNIAVAQVCGAENAVARGVPGPALPNEALNLGNLPLRAYADQVRADGAVAYWRLDEISGLTVRDSIGGNNGTISGGVTLNQSGALVGDAAMAFDGVDGRIVVPNGPFLHNIGLGPFTLEFWLKETAVNPASGLVLFSTFGTDVGNGGFTVYRLAGDVNFYFYVRSAGGGPVLNPVVIPHDGQWRHIVWVFTRGASDTSTVYVNSGVPTSNTGPAAASLAITSSLYIGCEFNQTSNYPCTLDEIVIYQTALTPAQIATHYQAASMVNENIRVGIPGPNPEIP